MFGVSISLPNAPMSPKPILSARIIKIFVRSLAGSTSDVEHHAIFNPGELDEGDLLGPARLAHSVDEILRVTLAVRSPRLKGDQVLTSDVPIGIGLRRGRNHIRNAGSHREVHGTGRAA